MLSYKYQKPFILFHSRSNFTIYLHHILLPTFSESWVLQSEQRTLAASCNDTGQLLNPRLYTSILCNFWKKLMLKNGRKIQYNICFPFVLSRDGCKVKHTTPALWVIKGWGKWSESCKWVIHLQLFPHRHPPHPTPPPSSFLSLVEESHFLWGAVRTSVCRGRFHWTFTLLFWESHKWTKKQAIFSLFLCFPLSV